MASAVYKIEVDWDGNGSFADANEDISADVKSISYSRSKDEELGKASPGTLSIRVNNSDGKYSPTLPTGIYTNLLPKRVIKVVAQNLLSNYSFEVGDPPDDWTLIGGGATVSRSSTQAKIGTYSALLTRNGTNCHIYQAYSGYAAYAGKTVTLGCLVYATEASRVSIGLGDGIGSSSADTHTGVAGWEWLTTSLTVDASPTYLRSYLEVFDGDTSAYFDGAILVEGETVPEPYPNSNLFYGYIESITPHPDLASQDAYISAIDGLDFLARHELDTILYKDTLTGALVTNILDSAGWSATLRSIDDGQDTVPYAYWNKVKARFALQDIEDSELGFIIIDGVGNLRWEDRHHRYSATHQTSQATFNDTMVDITYDYSAKNIYNEVRATVTPWEVQVLTTLWTLEETPSLVVGETKTWWGDASVSGISAFVDEWTTPLKGTDYIVNSESGGGGDVEDDNVTVVTTKFAQSIKIAITNDAIHIVYITTLQARGTPYDDQTKVSRKSEDTTSQVAYQKRTLALDGKYLTDAEKAQDFTDYAVTRFKDPQAEISLTITNKNNTNLTQILTREVSDRITVQNTKLGLDADFFINRMEHEISEGGRVHRCTWYLVDATNEDFWCLDHSALGVGTKLGY